jgi:hypothetical protein
VILLQRALAHPNRATSAPEAPIVEFLVPSDRADVGEMCDGMAPQVTGSDLPTQLTFLTVGIELPPS